MSRSVVLLATLLFVCSAANASTILIDFETVPVIATGPMTFAAAGAMQTIVVPNVATFTGGVILGNETNLPAQSFDTPPNVYATAGPGFADPSLQSTLTLTISPGFLVNQVSFPLFNGSTQMESYVVDAFNGATLVATQTLANLAANINSGYGIVDLLAANITSVTIAPTALDAACCGGWDYSIDSVALNETVQQAFGPEPSTFVPLGLSLTLAVLSGSRLPRRSSVG